MRIKTKAMSRKDIRRIAKKIRIKFNMDNNYYIDIVKIYEIMSFNGVFLFEIVPVNEMKDIYGETITEFKIIRIREDIYNNACIGDGFARSTMCHELFHLLGHRKKRLVLSEEELKNIKVYEDPEWQANCFAGELLVNKKMVKYMNSKEVMLKCKVTKEMAEYQKNIYNKERI